MNIAVGQHIRFAYNNLMRNVKVEKVEKTYITGIVTSENNVPKSFRHEKMFMTQVIPG